MAIGIILIIRLAIPLLILRRPFWGMVAAVLADGADMEFLKLLGPQFDSSFAIDFEDYQHRDKLLDIYMSSLALYSSLAWSEALARRTNLALYLWRFLGVVLFELTNVRVILLYFSNLFEFFFLFYAYTREYRADFRILNFKRLALILFILLIPKLGEEYLLHVLEARPWVYIKHDVLGWPHEF